MHISPPEAAPVESVESFRARAEAWIASRVERRPETTSVWGEGDFDVSVFHDVSLDEEKAHLDGLVAWHQAKLDAGFAAITWPTDTGGQGLTGAHERAFAAVEDQYDLLPGHELFNVTVKLIAPSIQTHGTPDQRARFATPFLRAEELCCQLFSEPGAGSDLAAVAMRARQVDGTWRLDGQKVWTSGAHLAPWGLAVCRTDPSVPKHAGMTAFLVPLDAPGVEVRPIRQMSGGSSFTEVFMSDVAIDDSLRIGEIGEGWKVALTVLGHERSTSGSSNDRGGSFDQLLSAARAQGVVGDPTVRQALAQAYTLAAVRTWTRQRAMVRVQAGQQPGPEGSLGKLLWTQSMNQMSEAISLVLGPALVADSGHWGTFAWSDHVLGAPGYRIAGGSDEIQRNIIGERILGLPTEPRVDRNVPFSQTQGSAASSTNGSAVKETAV